MIPGSQAGLDRTGRGGARGGGSCLVLDIGTTWWVDAPFEATPDFPGVWISRLIDTPVYRQWTEDVIHVGDCEIVPFATYKVRTTPDEVTFSDPLELKTISELEPGKYWGDVVGAFEGGVWTPPNTVVNFTDIQAAIKTFQREANAPHITWVDLEGSGGVPNVVLNFTDIQFLVLCFQSAEYPFSSPASCP